MCDDGPVTYFENRFDCRIHVLRTAAGGEYENVDLFCKRTGVERQRSVARNQASNGNAERMHRTTMNMARCMIFACELPLRFWGDAVQYTAYILNRAPTYANAGRASTMKSLTKVTPTLGEIVVFGSPCTVYRDPSSKNFSHRAQQGMIVGISEATKDYRVYLAKYKKVVTTQHVRNIETLAELRISTLYVCTYMKTRWKPRRVLSRVAAQNKKLELIAKVRVQMVAPVTRVRQVVRKGRAKRRRRVGRGSAL